MRTLLVLTLLVTAACAPDVPVGAPDSAAPEAAEDVDVSIAVGTDAVGELPQDVFVPVDVAPDLVVPTDVPPDAPSAPDVEPDSGPVDAVVVDLCVGKTCSDGNLCTTDSCESGKCIYLPTSATCTDGNFCTVGDACKDGLCLPGAVTDCSDGLACTVDSCSPAVGCAAVVSTTCDDGDPCTLDGCGKSGCTHGAAPSGCDDGSPCTLETCAGGACVHTYVDGPSCCTSDVAAVVKCDDGNPCTVEYCVNNQCEHTAPKGGCCISNADCTEGNICLAAICDTAQPQADHFICKYVDQNPDCTACSGQLGDCNDGNMCTVDTCQLKPNLCVNTPIAGCCLDDFDCDDQNLCTKDECVANQCQHPGYPAGQMCWGGTCDGQGTCVPAAPMGMVFIAGGTFWMGCNALEFTACVSHEAPQHKVALTPYYMDLTETTVAQYKACVDAGACTVPSQQSPAPFATYPGYPDHPVNNVSWTQALAYCKWRGGLFDLPTEAQWEMAARGSCEKNGSTASAPTCATAMRTYPWGESPPTCTYAVMFEGPQYGCGTNSAWQVGSKTLGDSPYGLHDMAGNVEEWTRDTYDPYYYSKSPAKDPADLGGGSAKVVRGGSFYLEAGYQRAGNRDYVVGSGSSGDIGMRCVRAYP